MEEVKGTNQPRRKGKPVWGRLLFWVISLVILLLLIVISMPNYIKMKPPARGSLVLVPGEDTKSTGRGGGYGAYSPGYESDTSARRTSGITSQRGEKGALTAVGEAVFGTPAYAQVTAPKVIYTGSVDVKVADLKESYDSVVEMLPRYRGYLASSRESSEGQRQWVSITVRVANEKLNEFLLEVRALGEVLNLSLQSEEVTSEFVDLEARLKQLEASAERMLALMQRSGKLADLLSVERELMSRQTQIEQIEGRLRQLRDQVALATITIKLFTEAPPPQVTGFTWGFGETVSAAWTSFKITLRAFAKAAIWLIVYVPVWLLVLLALWFIWWLLKRWGVLQWEEVEEEGDSS